MKPDPGNIPAGLDAWKRQVAEVSLPEVHRSIFVPGKASFWRKAGSGWFKTKRTESGEIISTEVRMPCEVESVT